MTIFLSLHFFEDLSRRRIGIAQTRSEIGIDAAVRPLIRREDVKGFLPENQFG